MKWIRNKIRSWLGVHDGHLVAMDLRRHQSCIIVVFQAPRPRVEIIDVFFKSYQDANREIMRLRRMYKTEPVIDASMDFYNLTGRR